MNHDRVPSSILGFTLFQLILDSVQHGYFETERFQDILVRILLTHINRKSTSKADGVDGKDNNNVLPAIEWISVALNDVTCQLGKTQRVVKEIIISVSLSTRNSVHMYGEVWAHTNY